MNITVSRVRRVVEEYDVPVPLDGAAVTDAELLSLAHERAPLSTRIADVGGPVIAARGPSDVESVGQRLARIDADRAAAMLDAKRVAAEAFEAGASERFVASTLGVDRATVRSWRGKARA